MVVWPVLPLRRLLTMLCFLTIDLSRTPGTHGLIASYSESAAPTLLSMGRLAFLVLGVPSLQLWHSRSRLGLRWSFLSMR